MNDAWKTPEARTVVPAVPAATVLLLRERDGAMEVMMVKRGAGAFFGSALVFPGGKVDEGDAHPGWDNFVEGAEGLDRDQIALRIAGWREVHEETGALPAACATTSDLAEDDIPFIERIRLSGGRLPLGEMIPFARWITPKVSPKRFDTWFFLCALDSDEPLVCDGWETVSAEWLTPARALELGAKGERNVIFPTRCQLERLGQSATIAEAVEAARQQPIITIEPKRVERDGAYFVTIPQGAGYPVTETSADRA
jgi:8-oxo-dGTP pyrophosphatase MutT (NUDIX family)